MSRAYYNEIEPYAAEWLRNLILCELIADGDVDTRSIEDVRPGDLAGYTQCHFFAGIGAWSWALRRAGWPDTRPVWTGSCPCQPFSSAGQGRGMGDERHLWPAWFHLISECRPAVLLGEQVAGKDAEPWVDLVHTDLEAVGYAFGAIPFPASGVGAPHIRDRLYWVAYADQGRSGRHAGAVPGAQTGAGWGVRGLPDGAEPGGAAGGVAHTNKQQRHGRRYTGQGGRPQPADERAVGGQALANAAGRGCGVVGGEAGSGDRGHTDSSEPTFWSGADWIPCRDGRWRPVEPVHVKVVDGFTALMGHLRAAGYRETQEGVMGETLQTVRSAVGAQTVQRPAGGYGPLQGAGVLRSGLHGALDGRADPKTHHPEQPPAIGEARQRGVPSMPAIGPVHPALRPPPRREPTEQRAPEPDDVVRLLPPSCALAELYGDRRTARALQALRTAIYEDGPVLHASDSVQEVWARLSEEAKSRLRMAIDVARWEIVVPFPLVEKGRTYGRTGRLRGYGNAINGPAAVEWIRCVMECMPT